MAGVTKYKGAAKGHELFREAKKFMPGGVNSPVRSFKGVGGYPIFVNRASGSKFYDESGGEFIDYCLSWGALILGHAHPEITGKIKDAVNKGTSFGTATKLETELARLIVEAVPSIEQVRLTSSGTEAVMSAIRLARAYTKKDKIIKFDGSYHGHADYLLVKAGSGATTLGIPNSLGVPRDFTKHTLLLPYNDLRKVEDAIKKYSDQIACIVVEPVMANCGVILPKADFLKGLRRFTNQHGIVLIFDEVITGFRLSYGGAQEYFDIKPDLTCLGKIVGGGMPIGVFGGRKEIMKLLAPEGPVYQAGTLSGNPVAVTAGLTILQLLKEIQPYKTLEKKMQCLCDNIKRKADQKGIEIHINHIASIFSVFFSAKEINNYEDAQLQNQRLFKKFYHHLLKRGIYFSPSGFEANFLSVTHSTEDIEITLEVITKIFKTL